MKNTPKTFSKDLDAWQMKSHELNNSRNLLYGICLPMNSSSELQISLWERNQLGFSNKIVLEVVSLGSLPTVKSDEVEYEFKKEGFTKGNVFYIIPLLLVCVTMFAGRTVYHMGQSEHLKTQDLYSRLKVLMESHELNEARNILDCICLPMHNSTAELQISLSEGHRLHYPIKTVLEVVPFGIWPTVTTPNSGHVDKKTKNDMCKVS
ncbi:hypothetical protein CAEBREN_26038 [Caenorhabditis brenneri]|uniref:Uncharacterized protein n=1 Tax=Caenorhabditis brenneri TaxID=135651 RepID=G0MDN2_CAEBE|nr:hypothetical protein CAEBREN_26038 [Caenorhabditis brenneri]